MPSQNTTKKTNPYHKRISSEPISKNLISSPIVIDKYPEIELQPGKDKIQEISDEIVLMRRVSLNAGASSAYYPKCLPDSQLFIKA